ncbi:MAG TPA: FHA domain-containing protein [Ktedonobacterales bacterium]
MTVVCSQGHQNPDGSAFCDECGEPLAAPGAGMPAAAPAVAPVMGGTRSCPNCGSANPASEAFCKDCGANMNAAPAPQMAATPAPAMVAPAAVAAAPAVAASPAKLVLEGGNASFDITGKSDVLIGREDAVSNIFPDVDLAPHGGEEGGVGRRHARITFSNGQYLIEDLNSINFTFVNKQKIAPKTPTPIKNGDEVRLGRVVLKFSAS